MKRKFKTVLIRFDPEVFYGLKVGAAGRDLSMAQLIRHWIKDRMRAEGMKLMTEEEYGDLRLVEDASAVPRLRTGGDAM